MYTRASKYICIRIYSTEDGTLNILSSSWLFLLQVAWVRVDTQTILSIHHNVITQNPRVTLSYNDHRSWYLHIRDVHEEDRGWYMCQVNTDPMRSRQGYLQVVGECTPNELLLLLLTSFVFRSVSIAIIRVTSTQILIQSLHVTDDVNDSVTAHNVLA
jgi:hypothetical protein